MSRLGVGGMGEVYLGHDTTLDRPVALKILPPELVKDEDRVRRFVQEAKSASALNHPHIVTIYEIGHVNAQDAVGLESITSSPGVSIHYIAMEFIDGVTLRAKIYQESLELKKILKLLAQAAEGLAKAHNAGIIHRDLKPENIMVSNDGYAKIVDFGLAKLLETQIPHSDDVREADTLMMRKTQPGLVMGTVGYMSPEQVQGKAADHRSDIFSFGCILFEAATRKQPFEGDTTIDSLHKIIYSPTPLLKDLNPEAPAELQRMIRKCLAKEPDQRYQSIRDLAVDLTALVSEYDSQPTVTGGYSGPQPTISTGRITGPVTAQPISQRRRTYLIGLIGLIVLAAIGIGLYRFVFSGPGKGTTGPPFQTMRMSRLTNTGTSVNAALSPDGRYVVHAVTEAGKQSLWVRHVATTSNVQIVPAADVHYTGLTFSRDGNFIYYVTIEKGALIGVLYQIPVLGGQTQKLIEDVDSPITTSPDSKKFAFIRNAINQRESHLVMANFGGSEERVLASRKLPDSFVGGPDWSPDGNTIVCPLRSITAGIQANIVGVSLADGTQRELSQDKWLNIGRAAWLNDGSGLVMTAADLSTRLSQVWYLSYPDGVVRRITNDLNTYAGVAINESSNGLVTVQADQLSNIWVASKAGESASQLSVGAGRYEGAGGVSWTPDGKIVYCASVNGYPDIWIMNSDGSNRRQLTHNAGINIFPAVSPDGRHIVFTSSRGGAFNIWKMDIDGKNPVRLTNGSGENMATISPDGRWVAFIRFDTGRPNLWKVPYDGGEASQLSEEFLVMPQFSPDAKSIACLHWDGELGSTFSFALFSLEGDQSVKKIASVGSTAQLPIIRWSNDGRSLIVIESQGGVGNLWSLSLNDGNRRQLTNFQSDQIFAFDWSRDGQLAAARGTITTDVVMITELD